ncbi:protein kinase pkn1 [Seminavis robusta]|uniref:Protein kinase pkn1 n=1 Tax=Seminavis robusta TaxID=568900 RepID=A0A9N8HT02_9STRA|nr:protein kinase pkn1 [Seminavis robusta]|eukprot:Sro1220_g253570.1 protein kinase pkn1 (812) ;mRNA; r:23501-25936
MTMEDLEKQYSTQLEELRAELKEQILPETTDAAALDQFVSSTALDDKLVQYVMLYEATPKGLAEFASQNAENAAMIQSLLSNTALLKEMLLADSPMASQKGRGAYKWSPALYGPAMKIYSDILEASEHASKTDTILGRLALAIALELAVPLPQENPKTPPDGADEFVDPVRRYLNYEMAFLDGELDPAFELLSAWELRFVVDGAEPDETLVWGREMLKNYRPDNMFGGYAWRYSNMVRSNVRYWSGGFKYDQPHMQQYQNILMNGGVCGRRAFFGRFILRAFGIPTTARPSRGHGALCHWTPNEGWVVNLGGGFGCGWTKTRYVNCGDFYVTTQARNNAEDYWKVKRAQWIGDVMEETRIYGEHDGAAEKNLGFWYKLSLETQKAIIEAFPNKKAPPRTLTGDHKPTIAEKIQAEKTPPSQVRYEDGGVIKIPADAFINPRQTKDVQVMKSFLFGGNQIYLPEFSTQGLSVLRSSTWKSDPQGCRSGFRLKSGGYGQYHDWGFRVAITGVDASSSCPNESMTVDLAHDGKVMMDFVYIKPGTFVMGGENETDDRFLCVEVPKHEVTLTRGFWLGKYPVTQAQYEIIMGSNPSKSTKDPDCPVDNIGEGDALEYCEKLVETIGKDFRLPTEAEWEYAARGGQGDTRFFFGDDESLLGDYAWFNGNSDGKSHPVGQKKPNPFGLYDIIGNVLERCSDRYDKDYYKNSPSVDPTGPQQGTKSTFEYKINVPQAGNYLVEAEVVTANAKQRLNVMVNGDEASTAVINMPCTNGYWQDSETVTIALKQGENTLRFLRDKPPQLGISIKGFTVKPAN